MQNKLKILIIGAGWGREHALGWKIAQSGRAGELFFARGNAGTAQIGTNLDIKETDTSALSNFAKFESADVSVSFISKLVPICAVPALPLAKNNSPALPDWAIFQPSACSRPQPAPIIKIFNLFCIIFLKLPHKVHFLFS